MELKDSGHAPLDGRVNIAELLKDSDLPAQSIQDCTKSVAAWCNKELLLELRSSYTQASVADASPECTGLSNIQAGSLQQLRQNVHIILEPTT